MSEPARLLPGINSLSQDGHATLPQAQQLIGGDFLGTQQQRPQQQQQQQPLQQQQPTCTQANQYLMMAPPTLSLASLSAAAQPPSPLYQTDQTPNSEKPARKRSHHQYGSEPESEESEEEYDESPTGLSGVSQDGTFEDPTGSSTSSSTTPQGRRGRTSKGHHGKPPRKGPWCAEEDQMLSTLVEKYGAKDWSFIASHIEGRIGKQCRERYHNHLAPDVRKDAWAPEEDDAIIRLHTQHGNKWTEISRLMGNGRPPNAIKNRWNSALKRRVGQQQSNNGSGNTPPPGLLAPPSMSPDYLLDPPGRSPKSPKVMQGSNAPGGGKAPPRIVLFPPPSISNTMGGGASATAPNGEPPGSPGTQASRVLASMHLVESPWGPSAAAAGTNAIMTGAPLSMNSSAGSSALTISAVQPQRVRPIAPLKVFGDEDSNQQTAEQHQQQQPQQFDEQAASVLQQGFGQGAMTDGGWSTEPVYFSATRSLGGYTLPSLQRGVSPLLQDENALPPPTLQQQVAAQQQKQLYQFPQILVKQEMPSPSPMLSTGLSQTSTPITMPPPTSPGPASGMNSAMQQMTVGSSSSSSYHQHFSSWDLQSSLLPISELQLRQQQQLQQQQQQQQQQQISFQPQQLQQQPQPIQQAQQISQQTQQTSQQTSQAQQQQQQSQQTTAAGTTEGPTNQGFEDGGFAPVGDDFSNDTYGRTQFEMPPEPSLSTQPQDYGNFDTSSTSGSVVGGTGTITPSDRRSVSPPPSHFSSSLH